MKTDNPHSPVQKDERICTLDNLSMLFKARGLTKVIKDTGLT
jgi:hypothetical protein